MKRRHDRLTRDHGMGLGAFSISLAVKNLQSSKTFYETN